jgi:hypothetical protein
VKNVVFFTNIVFGDETMNMQVTMKKRLLTVCVALGLFATANPLAADGPGEGVNKTVAGMVVNPDSFSGPVRCSIKNVWVCGTPYLNDRFSDPLKTVWEEVVTTAVATKDGVISAAKATKNGVVNAAKATKKGVVTAANSTGRFFKRGWEKFGW